MESVYGNYERDLERVLGFLEEQLEQANREAHERTGEYLYEHILGRIKSEESMREKCRRRNLPQTWQSALFELKDAIGIRVVCSFVEDIYTLRKAFEGFENCRIVEEKDYIRHAKPNGYRSYHLILEIDDSMHEEGPGKLFAEIQLRTIAMDSWASLEHKLKYKKNIKNQEMIGLELKRCADELAGCDLSMQTIRDLIRQSE
ncbi:MAG: GTP pyrophosphokinase family protein [Lachnospiraceae bacterium]|nr:GTP pyrophosphokinase family protein [Lachnospiraceae bacterium]